VKLCGRPGKLPVRRTSCQQNDGKTKYGLEIQKIKRNWADLERTKKQQYKRKWGCIGLGSERKTRGGIKSLVGQKKVTTMGGGIRFRRGVRGRGVIPLSRRSGSRTKRTKERQKGKIGWVGRS